MSMRVKWSVLAGILVVPLLVGATCSTNAVAQSTATTFFGAVASNIVNLVFNTLGQM